MSYLSVHSFLLTPLRHALDTLFLTDAVPSSSEDSPAIMAANGHVADRGGQRNTFFNIPSSSSSSLSSTPTSGRRTSSGLVPAPLQLSREMGERTRLLQETGDVQGTHSPGRPRREESLRRNYTEELDGVGAELDMRKAKTPNGDSEPSTPIRRSRQATIDVAKKIKQRSKYYIPVTDWLPKYNWQLFSGDFGAGISIACLLVPQSMSYANGLAKLNPIAGLWSSAIPALVYGALGTCRQLSLGPESAICLVIGQMIQEKVWGNPNGVPENPEMEALAISLVTTFQCTIITLTLGFLRLGFMDVVLSRALLRGFITAVGVVSCLPWILPAAADRGRADPGCGANGPHVRS